ncbi:glucosamine-6-phosphate deaminase [Clostridium aestuarii]|uniref:Glucosamine-6-phosphate deaminase n=1 Tax=Clostridium aestuarii TaxID=338193 RepID=A0ABT4D2B8_9CLOT|nr:glucosamine-6-phosphate deaminase [Clostridium aestuarii]MCY6484178.1 glucosamine-6-phosphate deaminase [Clostridium aestuarii]
MRIMILKDYNEMSKKAAKILASQVILKPNSILGLATGSTPVGMYNELIKFYNANEIDFSEVKTFNLDEYYGLNKNNEQSYYYFMMNNFFKHVNINLQNINIPNGMAEDIEKECFEYEEKILQSGGIDIQVLGIGANGHIGFNEPDVNFEASTHLVELEESTIKANSRFFKYIDEVPKKAISMGMKTIMQSKQIILLASGKNKAEVIKNAIEGKITPTVPASILQLHTNVTFIIDEAAASKLESKIEVAYG